MRHTLKSSKEFKHVKAIGRRYVGSAFIVEMAPFITFQPAEIKQSRLGLIASKRIGNAVKRNFAKRRIRALWDQIQDKLMCPGDYVFIARSSILTEKFAFLQEELYKILRKIEKGHEKR